MAVKNRKEEIINALSEVKFFSPSGSIPSWNSIIWKEISEKLNRYDCIV